MMAFGFFNGDTQNASPEAIKRRREFAAKLLSTRAPRNIGEGFNAIGNNIAAAIDGARADRMEAAGNAEANRLLQPFFGSPTASAGNPVATGRTAPSMASAPAPAALAPLFAEKEQAYGLPPGYLARTAQIESNFNPAAKNPNSSATGLFQFINSTARQYGLSDPRDPVASTAAAARLAADNRDFLARRLGREPTAGELYLAHQQGAGGAAKLLANPDAPAESIVGGAAARLNRGAGMTAGAFANQWIGKFGNMPTAQGRPTVPMPTATGGQPTAPMPMASLADMPAPDAALAQAGPDAGTMAGMTPPEMMPDAAPQPTAPGLGVLEATNEAETQFLENRMAAEQGQAAPVEAPPVNQGDVFSPIPMGGGFNPFVQRPPFGDAPSAAPAPAAAEAALQPRMVDAPMPPQRPTDLAPQSPFVPQTMRQPMPEAPNMPQSDNDVAGAFARSGAMGNVFPIFGAQPQPQMAAQQQPQAPQLAAGGVSQGAPMNIDPGQNAPQQPNSRSQQLAAIMASPMVPPQMKQMAWTMYQQEQAQTLARQEQARTQAQNEAAARAAGIDPALAGNPTILSGAVQNRFANKSENIAVTNQAREAEANRLGLTGDQRNAYILNGQIPTREGGTAQISNETRAREAEAARIGLKPGDPRYQNYVLTGKMPREDAQPLTATDKKAILEADELVNAGQAVIRSLEDAKKLSPRVNTGYFASGRASIGNALPDALVPDFLSSKESSEATAIYENLVTGQALGQLKTMFGAAPTEGERKILLELQASVNKPDSVRQEILGRAMAEARKSLEFNRQRAASLRGNEYYKPEAQRSAAQGNAPPANAATPAPAQSSGALQAARDAIAKGASREAVINRLRQNGIDPGGL
jgi:hypothetical protein